MDEALKAGIGATAGSAFVLALVLLVLNTIR